MFLLFYFEMSFISCFINTFADTNCFVVSGVVDKEDAEMRKAR